MSRTSERVRSPKKREYIFITMDKKWIEEFRIKYKNKKNNDITTKNDVKIYTDGCSKGNPGIGGYGVVLIYDNGKGDIKIKELMQGYKLTTNNRMELMGPLVAFKQLKKSCNIDFYSDSKYFVDAFNQKWIDKWLNNNFRIGTKSEVKNLDIWQELLEEVVKHNITFHWVKGHDGDYYNERCDELANESLNYDLIEDKNFK